jgi:hypothetical protein
MKISMFRMSALPLLLVCGAVSANAQQFPGYGRGPTQGPSAVLYKLSDHWVSVLPSEPVIEVAPVVAPQPVLEPGFRPEANYSGACHVTVDLNSRTYMINETSSTEMVGNQGAQRVCLPTEKIAIDMGFQSSASR